MHLPKPMTARTIGILAAVITVIIWTSFIVIARASAVPAHGGTLNPFDIVFVRLLGAGAILLPVGWWMVRRDRANQVGASSFFGLSPLSLRRTVQTGLFGGSLYAVLAYSGFVYAPAGHASVLLPGSLPLWTALLAAIILGTRVTPARALGLACIVAGGALVGGASLLRAFDGGDVWKGDLLFLCAALSWSVYSVLVRRFALEAVRATAAITVFAFVLYVPLYSGLLLAGLVPGALLVAPAGEIAFQMLFQGVGSVVISGITFTRMIQYFGPVRSTMITALVPGLSALAAVLLLGEPMEWNLLLGLAMVTVGIVFGVRSVAMPVPAVPGVAVSQRQGT